MTDNEIIKALECCGNDKQCTDCPMNDSYPFCDDIIGGIALDLIDRLQAENEKWQEVAFKHEETMQIIATEKQYYFDELQNKKAENERLEKLSQERHLHIHHLNGEIAELRKTRYLEVKAEAYKEFADRLKPYEKPNCSWCVHSNNGTRSNWCDEIVNGEPQCYALIKFESKLDNLLKEMGGEDNE